MQLDIGHTYLMRNGERTTLELVRTTQGPMLRSEQGWHYGLHREEPKFNNRVLGESREHPCDIMGLVGSSRAQPAIPQTQ